MSERKSNLGLGGIKEQALAIANSEGAQDFVKGAMLNTTPTKVQAETPVPFQKAKKQRKLVVDGHLRNRNESCHNPIQLYLRNELFDWIEQNATAGRGGTQIVINYLVRRGIEAVEKEFQENGIVFADEGK
jgi:hypothetical protein